jgi:glycine cleavage system aminomethyltransferase T
VDLKPRRRLIFAGYAFDDQVDPFEAGIGFTVKLGGEEDFVGKEQLTSSGWMPVCLRTAAGSGRSPTS